MSLREVTATSLSLSRSRWMSNPAGARGPEEVRKHEVLERLGSGDEQDALDAPTWGWTSSEGRMRDTDESEVFTWGWHSSEGRIRDYRSPPGRPRNREIVRPGSVTPRASAPAARAEAGTASFVPDGNLTMQDLEFESEGGRLPPAYTSPVASGRPKDARDDSVAHGTDPIPGRD